YSTFTLNQSVAGDVLDLRPASLAKRKDLKALGVDAMLRRRSGLPTTAPAPRSTSPTIFDVQRKRLLQAA
ncbi:hypothetical protein AB9K41_03545, partial [Cribrihabitans sp. XS_ASV171]